MNGFTWFLLIALVATTGYGCVITLLFNKAINDNHILACMIKEEREKNNG